MKLTFGGCSKFHRLVNEREDRVLGSSEEEFLEKHRRSCSTCSRQEEAMHRSLNMLRAASMDAVAPDHFDLRLMRLVRVASVKDGLNYWKPAFFGCAIACLALFAMLHVLTVGSPRSSASLPTGEARLDVGHFPDLELSHVPRLVR